jgi:hypothetical protein
MSVLRVSSRTNARRSPAGCHAGRESSPAPFVMRLAAPPAALIVQSHPRAENAMVRPSGETAGYVGPAE